MAITKPAPQNKYSEQYIQNSSYDADFDMATREIVGYDGVNLQRIVADSLAIKVTVDGSVTYIGIAAPGTTQASAFWQCKKVDESSGIVVTWADGDANFDNVATDLTALDYS